MARRRVYIKPFLSDGTYSQTWIEVTKDVTVDGVGAIQKRLDVSDYDIGIFTNSAVSLSFINTEGKYSDIDVQTSMFKTKRADSLVKITYDESDYDFWAGNPSGAGSFVGDILGAETTVFTGLLNDDSTTMQLRRQSISFNILGYESIFDRAIAPDWGTSPPADNKCSTLIKALLHAANAALTQPVLTIDNAQIVPENDISFDDLSVFANKTVKEALNDILLASNSVLYLNDSTPIVSSRAAGAAIAYNFYGPASELGPENITDIVDIRSGTNRTFNFITWNAGSPTTLNSQDVTSISAYGYRTKDITIEGITNGTTQQSIIDNIKNEFKLPKQEFKLTTPIKTALFSVGLLNRVVIDYPQVYVQTEDLPFYDVALYGSAQYPVVLAQFSIPTTDNYKIIALEINLISNQIKYTMRKI